MQDQTAYHTARVLTEALPYIQRFSDKTVVVKYGGNAMIDNALQSSFARDVVLLKQIGLKPVVVHGGGPQIGEALKKLGKQSQFINGMRVTDAETMQVVQETLTHVVNKHIIDLIASHGGQATAFTGEDDRRLVTAKPLRRNADDNELGYVGEVDHIDPDLLATFSNMASIPVIAPIGFDASTRPYNINADLVAGSIATALSAEKLILMTNTSGVLDNQQNLLTDLNAVDVATLISDGTIHGGMLPKIQCALDAIAGGVNNVHIIDGRVQHAVLLELMTDAGVGTLLGG